MHLAVITLLGDIPALVPNSNAPGHEQVLKIANAVLWFVLVAIAIALVVFAAKFVFSFWNDDTSSRNAALKGIVACGIAVFLVGGGGRALINSISAWLA